MRKAATRGLLVLMLSMVVSDIVLADDPPPAPSAGSDDPAPAAIPVEPAPANAVPSSQEAASGDSSNRFVEEIVVTAQKREENLQDVPISMQAFSSEALDAKGISTAIDLPKVTPGMTYTELAGYSIVYIRGIGTDAFIPSADLSVPTYIDGIYFPFSSGLVQSFGAVDRVEVLKGPQGTLFGRNTTGGAISVITRNPGKDFEGSAQVSYSSYDNLKLRLYTSVPVTNSLAFSVSGVYNRENSYYHDLTGELGKNFSEGARVKLHWTPSDNVDATLAGVIVAQGGPGTSVTQRVAVKPDVASLGQQPNKPYETNTDVPPIDNVNSEVVYGNIKWSTSWFDLKLLGSDQAIHTHAQLDFDATPLPIASTNAPNGFGDIQTGEFQILSNKDSWGESWLTYTGGLYFIHSNAGYNPLYVQVGIYNADAVPGVGAVLGPFLNESLSAISQAGGIPTDPITAKVQGIIDTKAGAGYLQGTASITDWFSLTLGGRVQRENRELTTATVGFVGVGPNAITYAPRGVTSNNFSPKISLDFRPFDRSLIYLSGAKGFKSGTYNIINLYTQPTFVKPEDVTSYELGFKSEFFDRSLRLNGAIFQNMTKNLQVQVISLTSGGAIQFQNAEGARTRGGEFDLTWVPLRETLPGLVLSANGSYLYGIYTNFKDGSGFDPTTGLFFGPTSPTSPGRDFTGNRIVRTPRFSGAVSPSYSIGRFEFAADIYLNSGFYFTAQNTRVAKQAGYTTVGVHVSYLYQPWGLRFTVFGQNVNDGKEYLYQFENDFGTSGLLAAPAVYGGRINWEF